MDGADLVSSSISTSTTSTSSFNSRKTSNFFPHFNHPSSYNLWHSNPQSKAQSFPQITTYGPHSFDNSGLGQSLLLGMGPGNGTSGAAGSTGATGITDTTGTTGTTGPAGPAGLIGTSVTTGIPISATAPPTVPAIQTPNMVSAPITPLLNNSNNSTPLFNDYDSSHLDTSIWKNNYQLNSHHQLIGNRTSSSYHGFPHVLPYEPFVNRSLIPNGPDDMTTPQFNSFEELNSNQHLKLNQFQFQYDDLLENNQLHSYYSNNSYPSGPLYLNYNDYPQELNPYVSGSNIHHSFSSTDNQSLDKFTMIPQSGSDNFLDDGRRLSDFTNEELLSHSVNVALDMNNDNDLKYPIPLESGPKNSASNESLPNESYKSMISNITIDLPKCSKYSNTPELTVEKFPEDFSSSFYKRNNNGYMFIKETNDELIKVNQLSTQPDTAVTFELLINVNNLCKQVEVNVSQLYNTELFNDIKIIKRKSNVLKRFRR